MKFFSKILKGKKGLTGADIAAAITVITLTVGIVTAIYVNTLNKSKSNVRYANATRIATNIMENIQKKPYEYLTAFCDESYSISGGNNVKAFGTKIPNGYSVTITAKKTSSGIDIARDLTVSVKYKTSSTYKTISLSSVKEKELMDMTNSPDISLIPDYNPSEKGVYYYPVIEDSTSYKVVTMTDMNWYDYEEGKYALICKTSDGTLEVGETANNGTIYVWIPRFVSLEESDAEETENVQFLYGTSSYKIGYYQYGDLFSYGVHYTTPITADSLPDRFDSGFEYTSFEENDGLNGVWYEVGRDYEVSDKIYLIAKDLNSKITCLNETLQTTSE